MPALPRNKDGSFLRPSSVNKALFLRTKCWKEIKIEHSGQNPLVCQIEYRHKNDIKIPINLKNKQKG